MAQNLWDHVLAVRKQSPLIHNVTNFVVMNNTANALLAIGASPVMAHAHSEVEEMVSICQALVINIGTLDEYFAESMLLAASKANKLNKPWILDPVGAGATKYRNGLISKLITHKPNVIRGNASEILSIAQTDRAHTKGVDSLAMSDEAIDAAKKVYEKYGSIVCISGATDIIIGNGKQALIQNGSALMTKVTGLGCSATAIIGAFIATIENKYEAVCAAMAMLGICGEIAEQQSSGPGSLQMNILNKLYNITENEFSTRLKISENA